MINNLKNTFSNIKFNNCFKTKENSLFFIEDRDKKITVFNKKENAKSQFFKIINTNKTKINFLEVDNCLYLDKDGKRSDFILFKNKYFLFIELKKIRKSSTTRSMKKAIEQLEETVKEFRNRIDFSTYNLEAYVCIGKKGRPRTNATLKADKANFIINHNTKLFGKCEKIFN